MEFDLELEPCLIKKAQNILKMDLSIHNIQDSLFFLNQVSP